jgi:hypothetical protein
MFNRWMLTDSHKLVRPYLERSQENVHLIIVIEQ